EKLEEETPVAASQADVAAPSGTENQFQEWMNNRNAELEAKALELEKKFQEPPPAQTASGDNFSGGELMSAPIEPDVPAAPPSASPIDFNAPIAPPFMGPPVAAQPPAAAEPAPPPEGQAAPLDAEELKRLQAEYEFLMLYDEFRNIIVFELKDLVGEKKTFTMLGRTVELAREKFPEIFRNANWDSTGNLLEDGSMDSQRLIENKNSLELQKADAVLDSALATLLKLRLQAVEKGLGTGLKNKVRAHLYQWISEKTQKAVREGKNALNLKRLSGYVAST
ncbi:MAG TPA: hypothetical protein VJ873_08525, partial [bacterium]|nr:hypothetical protein [bacterium]